MQKSCRYVYVLPIYTHSRSLSLSLSLSICSIYVYLWYMYILHTYQVLLLRSTAARRALSLHCCNSLQNYTHTHTHTIHTYYSHTVAVNLRIRSWSLCMNSSSHIHCMAFLLSLLFKCREIRYDIMEDHSFLGHSYDSPSIMWHSMLRWHCPQCSRTENPLALSLFPSTLVPGVASSL